MKTDNKYFTAAVHLQEARQSLDSALKYLEDGVGLSAMSSMRKSLQEIAEAAEETYRQKARAGSKEASE